MGQHYPWVVWDNWDKRDSRDSRDSREVLLNELSPFTNPAGSWPRRMAADLAAAYCGERSVDAFLKRVGKDYPNPRVAEGRRRLWLRDDLDSGDLAGGTSADSRRRRGFVTMTLAAAPLRDRQAVSGRPDGFYFNVPSKYRELGCTVAEQAAGRDYTVACGEDGDGGRAARSMRYSMNGTTCAWPAGDGRARADLRHNPVAVSGVSRSKAYLEKVSPRSRPDYERTMQLIEDIVTKKGDKLGDRKIRVGNADQRRQDLRNHLGWPRRRATTPSGESGRAVPPRMARGPPAASGRVRPGRAESVGRRHDQAAREGEKAGGYPRSGLRVRSGAIEHGKPEAAAAAIICFEWLQRPENVLAGFLRWPDYRSKEWPNAIKILHHKTGAIVWHPLEKIRVDGVTLRFYPEAEAVLEKLAAPRRPDDPTRDQDAEWGRIQAVQLQRFGKARPELAEEDYGLPSYFTLDACRHGGMTELEEAALTEGQGRALSAHKTAQAYRGYAKETFDRALSATRKRHAHRLANAQGT